ncbi:MAG: hypothetical protein ACOX7H_03470 [Bacillota bacterium]|jgi:hypothetical protein
MKKILLVVFIACLSIFLVACNSEKKAEDSVRRVVEEFGQKLQTVSLQAPADIIAQSMQENYGDYVSPSLLARWQSDPKNAPGRLVSSPWPDRIEIVSVEKLSQDSYKVLGEIIEITSVEQQQGGFAAKQPITLVVKKINNSWLIDDVILSDDEQTSAIIYENMQYGFNFDLPDSWQGYTIVDSQWEGLSVQDPSSQQVVESGPEILIRHPDWTTQNPRQDIPIMIFTLSQWESLEREEFHIGAAPVGPSELGRNNRYVFALPARYNYSFPTGYEEVENILNADPLQTYNN